MLKIDTNQEGKNYPLIGYEVFSTKKWKNGIIKLKLL